MTNNNHYNRIESQDDPRQEGVTTKYLNGDFNPSTQSGGRISAEEAARIEAEITGQTQPAVTHEALGDDPYEAPKGFWRGDARHEFQKRVTTTSLAPTAAMVIALAKIASMVPPQVKTPLIMAAPEMGLKGAPATSLNLMVAIVGKSGAGKSGIIDAAERALRIQDSDLPPNYTVEGNPASGEGVASLFSPKILPGDDEAHLTMTRRNAFICNPEGSELFAKMNSKGSTLLPITLKAVFGESLSRQKADSTQNAYAPKGSYSLAIVFGIQPALAAQLIQDTSSGFAQRALCVPINDSRVEEITDQMWEERKASVSDRTDLTAAASWKPPTADTWFEFEDRVERRLVEMLSTKRHCTDEIDKHRPALLNKVMCLLALFDNSGANGKVTVSEDYLRDAELLLGICDMGREMILSALKEMEEKLARKRAIAETALERAKEDIYSQDLKKDMSRVLEVLTKLDKGQGVGRSALRKAALSQSRERFDTALEGILEEGQAHEKSGKGGQGRRVHLGPLEE